MSLDGTTLYVRSDLGFRHGVLGTLDALNRLISLVIRVQ